MDDLALQISTALQSHPNLRLVLGHGAGSFGHVPASEYHTRDGLQPHSTQLAHRERDTTDDNYWKGFAEVWYQAEMLNRYVMDALRKANVQAITLPPSGSVISSNGRVAVWESTPIRMALSAGIVPVIHGDVVFDEVRGGTILSTEDLFMHLARALNPDRILLAGLEKAVWEDFPARTKKIEKITPQTYKEISAGVGKAAGADVTGGMESKVSQMLELVKESSVASVQVFSGEEAGNIIYALTGESLGTLITM
jgi:isopentenyl phosphate kinase